MTVQQATCGVAAHVHRVEAKRWRFDHRLAPVVLVLALVLFTSVRAPALDSPHQVNPFEICEDQRYALCATASCFVFNLVAYCKCDVEFGDSISASYTFDGGDVCSVNGDGPGNGYMVSTYSLPDSVRTGGDQAVYTCRPRSSTGAYAQCDGGLCFTSTRGRTFPGFDEPLPNDQIICSCPITVADPSSDKIGYQIVGPYPCQDSFFDNCSRITDNTNTGSTIYVGAPTGTPRLLTQKLYGSVPKFNECFPPK